MKCRIAVRETTNIKSALRIIGRLDKDECDVVDTESVSLSGYVLSATHKVPSRANICSFILRFTDGLKCDWSTYPAKVKSPVQLRSTHGNNLQPCLSCSWRLVVRSLYLFEVVL